MSDPLRGNDILIDAPGMKTVDGNEQKATGGELVGWLIDKSDSWEAFRNRGYQTRWGEYWRLWRGMFAETDKNRQSERSRLIAPALSQAIEMTVAEIEEGIFSKEGWFDIADDLADQEKVDALMARDQLLEDFELAGVQDVVSEAVLVGAIFGSGIIKVNVEVVPTAAPQRDPDTKELMREEEERVVVSFESIRPDEFIPDPSGTSISEMLGCFHKVEKPLQSVLEKINRGIYNESALASLGSHTTTVDNAVDANDPQAFLQATDSDQVEILEYHGKVPLSMLNDSLEKKSLLDSVLATKNVNNDEAEKTMVEAIVTVANKSTLLRAMPNPFVMWDRSIIAFQFEKVPGRFWGRGVAEKGFNPQKALDAELRARIDALGYISSPMIGVDSGRIPRGFKMEIRPGKVWLTQGPPREVISPLAIGEINAASFSHGDALERMVQMGTGSFDTASALKSAGGAKDGSSSNSSLMMGAFVKRSKRAIRSINNNLLRPLITKTMWRYMQFAPGRYPTDFSFVVKPTLGIVAREVEAMQLTQLMGMLPEAFPQVGVAVAKGIIELSSLHNKAEIVKAMEAALAPPSEEDQKKQAELAEMEFEATKADAEGKLLTNQKTIAEIKFILAQATHESRKADVADIKTDQEQDRIEQSDQEIGNFEAQNEVALRRVEMQERALAHKIRTEGQNKTD